MAKKTQFQWLDRRIAAPGPFLTLVLSQAEFDQAMRHLKQPPGRPYIKTPTAHATAHYLHNVDGQLCAVVALRGYEGRNPIEVAGLLVHEAVHVWQAYCERIGEENPGSEQEAYAVQAISQELMAEFARRMA